MRPHLLTLILLSTGLLWGQNDGPPLVTEDLPPPTVAVESVAEEEIEDGGTTGVEESAEEVEEPGSAEPVRVFGWKEWIVLDGPEVRLKAKLDTGAKTSSIHAEDVKMLEKDGEKWVRFTVVVPNGEGDGEHSLKCEAPFSRKARIRNADGILSERIVVRLRYQIGELKREAEFSLNDRGDMIHPILLGRAAINALGLVDANRIYLADQKIYRQ